MTEQEQLAFKYKALLQTLMQAIDANIDLQMRLANAQKEIEDLKLRTEISVEL